MKRAFAALFAGAGTVFLACSSFEGGTEPETPDAAIEAASTGPGPVGEDATAGPSDASSVSESGPDAQAPVDGGCTAEMPFVRIDSAGNVVNLSNVNDTAPRLTPDELVMWVTRQDPGAGERYLAHFVRSALDAPWEYRGLAFGDTGLRREGWMSPDRKRLYDSQVTGGKWKALRADLGPDGNLATPSSYEYIPSLTGFSNELWLYAIPDESEFWVSSDRNGGTTFEIFHFLKYEDGGYSNPEAVTELNTTSDEFGPVVPADRKTIYFGSGRGRSAGTSIYMATRSDVTKPFGPPFLVPGLESLQDNQPPKSASAVPGWISPDNCRLYVASTKDDGSEDVFVASRR